MAKFSLEVACPNCRREVILEGGLAPEILRETVLLRAASEAIQVTCGQCGAQFALCPTDRPPVDCPATE